jgi:hypothetical protein
MTKSARNERLKITATYFNGSAIAAIAVGGFAPLTASLNGPPQSSASLPWVIVGWLCLSAGLHLLARVILRRIEE